jgi:hypothetical protein
MASQWSIKIIDLGNGTVTFQPDLPGAQRGQPLGANPGDLITWNNTTNRTLTLQSIPPGTYLTDPIPPGQVSDPIYRMGNASVKYACTNPTMQQHSIMLPTAPTV